MKTPTKPTAPRMPRARPHWALVAPYRGFIRATHEAKAMKATPDDYYCHCAVIPTPSASNARQIVRAAPFLMMGEEEQVETLRKLLARNWTGSYQEDARAVLAAIRGGAK